MGIRLSDGRAGGKPVVKTLLQLSQHLWGEGVRPAWREEDGIPTCKMDECPSYDGKRCILTGFEPEQVCEPAVRGMVNALRNGSSKTLLGI